MASIRISIHWEVVNTFLVFGKGKVRIEEVNELDSSPRLLYPEFIVNFEKGSWGCEKMLVIAGKKYWSVIETMVQSFRAGIELNKSMYRWVDDENPPIDHKDDESMTFEIDRDKENQKTSFIEFK